MRKILPLVLLAVVFMAQDAAAVIGNTYLTAYSRSKGVQASAGKYGTQMLLKTASQKGRTTTTKSGKKVTSAGYTQRVTFCKRNYYTTKRGKSWIAAHRRANHVLVVRRHTAKGKYRSICGTRPKRVTTKKKAS